MGLLERVSPPPVSEDCLEPGHESFASFFQGSRSKVFGAMCLVTGDRQEAEEITRDPFPLSREPWDRVVDLDDLISTLAPGPRSIEDRRS